MSRKPSAAAPSRSSRSVSSTGSPASRMSTKLVPLTTRPSSTSRQGITRLRCTPSVRRRDGPVGPLGLRALVGLGLQGVLALGDREAPFVERLARDDAAEVDLAQVSQRAQVVQG